MDVYSRLMDIDEVVECLNRKTDTDISFDKKKVLKLIENRIITIVFKFEGFVTWDCVSKGKYYSIEMSGYFNFTDESKAIGIFEGSLDEIPLSKAIIYHLDSPDIRGGAPDGIKPEKGDIVLFKTGGRPPALTPGLTPYLTTELSYLSIENSIKIYNNKVGVLKVDIEEYLKKKKIEAMENDTKMEALESKAEQLEAERTTLKYQQTEALEVANAKIKQQEQDINKLNDQLNNQADRPTNTNKKEGQGDSLLILGAVMHCIQDAAKKNYTQELLIQVILDKYKGVSGISEGTLKKKFPESKNYLNQKLPT
jgi:hypothetical protein